MSRISDDDLKLNEAHWENNEAWCKLHGARFAFEGALQLDLRDARSEIARLTEENARLTNVLSSKERSLKAWRSRCQTAEARLAAATTMTEQLADALRAHEAWEADIILHADWGPDGMSPLPTLTQAQMDALSAVQSKRNAAFVASKQAGNPWRPIDEAPRDGTWFLACATKPGWGATRIVRFAASGAAALSPTKISTGRTLSTRRSSSARRA